MELCLFLLFAGLLDALFTHYGIAKGVIQEGNPLMRYLINKNWVLFYGMKIALPLILIVICNQHIRSRIVHHLLITAVVLYLAVLVYHFAWVFFT